LINKFAICFLLVLISSIATQIGQVSAQPSVLASPVCGPSGFTTAINVNGFEPDSNIAWKLIDADQRVPLYGYFATNATGGFIEPLTIDDVPEGHYMIYFGKDSNDDGIFDSPSSTFVEIDIPCPEIPRQETVQPQPSPPNGGTTSAPQSGIWVERCQKIQNWLLNSCDIFLNSDGSLNSEGKRAYKCIVGGGLLALVGSIRLPPLVIIEILEKGAPFAKCAGIVDFQELKSAADPMTVLREFGIE
jgi:hypothetical protein